MSYYTILYKCGQCTLDSSLWKRVIARELSRAASTCVIIWGDAQAGGNLELCPSI